MMESIVVLARRIFCGLRFRLALLVALVCIPLVGLTLNTAWESRRHQISSWQQRSQKLMQLATREEEKLVGQTRQLLMAVAESAPVQRGNPRACRGYLAEISASYPLYSNLGVIKTNGEVLASTTPMAGFIPQPQNSFFARALQTRAFAISEFPFRLAQPPSAHVGLSGAPGTVEFGCPVFDNEGRIQAVVFATLNLATLNHLGSEVPMQLPKGAIWSQVDSKGFILARYPEPERWSGQPLPEPALLERVLQDSHGIVQARDSKGVRQVYAFTTMRSQLVGGPVVTILGTPRDTLFAEADRALVRNLSWLGVAVALAFLIGWGGSNFLIVRPIRALVRSSARLARGDLTARSTMPRTRGELGELSLTFKQMADALTERDLEQKRASIQVQNLSHRLVQVQETERRHIARELHDEIGQSLTVAEMNLQAALRANTSGNWNTADDISRRLKNSIQAVEQVLEQVKNLSLNLRPSMLDDLGLEPTLRWYTERHAAVAGLRAHLRIEPLEDRLDPVIETECFRVAQEALTNVVRHAQASSVTVETRHQNGQLLLSVRDDGIGFDVAAQRERAVLGGSLGLLSMEERTALAGGGLNFFSNPNGGTEVRAWFPLKWREPEAKVA
jgi:signal transduction histidine kinase